jgi:hypothetical protein
MKTTSGHLFQRGKKNIYQLEYTVKGKKQIVSLKTSNKRTAETRRDEILNPALAAKTSESVIRHIADARHILTEKKYFFDFFIPTEKKLTELLFH